MEPELPYEISQQVEEKSAKSAAMAASAAATAAGLAVQPALIKRELGTRGQFDVKSVAAPGGDLEPELRSWSTHMCLCHRLSGSGGCMEEVERVRDSASSPLSLMQWKQLSCT
jgi:hypothetical protein